MKRLIVTTIILLMLTALITVMYFKNLNTPGQQTSEVMRQIPDDASLILEIHNDQSLYDVFTGYPLFTAITGRLEMDDFDTLRKQLLMNPALQSYLDDQHIYISLHPLASGTPDWLITLSAGRTFKINALDQMVNQPDSKLIIQRGLVDGKAGYVIYLKTLKKRFYLVKKGENIFSGSFSKELAEKAAAYETKKTNQYFVLMPDRQNINSLANLYVNYGGLTPLFEQFFLLKNTDILKVLRTPSATATLTLNYKTTALMFNGTTTIQTNQPGSYLNLFSAQHPVLNHLKDIFPSSTAYSTSFAVSDPAKFTADLSSYHTISGLDSGKKKLFNLITKETGINLKKEFNQLLANEFVIITTRYQEKIAIIEVKNGLQLRPLMINISNMINDDVGQLKYEKLPFFLIGDAFGILKKPYFRILDNYLILANSSAEINSYVDSYTHQKFMNKTLGYNNFDELLSERCNVECSFFFKNFQHLAKAVLKPSIFAVFDSYNPGWKNFYGGSYQLAAANKNFYTNLCIQLEQPDTTKK
jgi:hypothetical protein